jgi:hypothetical protein
MSGGVYLPGTQEKDLAKYALGLQQLAARPLQRDRDRYAHGKRDVDGGHPSELRAGQRRLPVSENR